MKYLFITLMCFPVFANYQDDAFIKELKAKVKLLKISALDNQKQIIALRKKELIAQSRLIAANQKIAPSESNEEKTSKPSLSEKLPYPDRLKIKTPLGFPEIAFQSADGKDSFRMRTFIDFASDIFGDINGLRINNGVASPPVINQNTVIRAWLNSAGVILSSQLNNDIHMVVVPNFGRNQVYLGEGTLRLDRYKMLGLIVGFQVSPVAGLGQFKTSSYVTYPGFSSNLSATKETGVMLYGSLGYSENNHFDYYNYLGFNDWFSYQVGMFNGTSDGTYPGLNPVGTGAGIVYLASEAFALNKSFEGRVFFNPFLAKKDSTFQHLGIGVGASTQRPNSQTYLPFILSIGQNPIFGYQNSNTFAVSSRSRIHPQLVWYFQRLGLFADWGQTVQNLTTEITTARSKPNYVINQKNQASEIQMVFNLTGEAFTLDSLKPNRNFNLAERGAYGALQMVLRFSTLNIDGSTYGAYRVLPNKAVIYNISDPRVSISKATAWGIGFNWIWNPSLIMTSEFAQTKYIGGCSSGAFLDPINPGCLTASANYIRAPGSVMTNRPDEYVATETVKLLF